MKTGYVDPRCSHLIRVQFPELDTSESLVEFVFHEPISQEQLLEEIAEAKNEIALSKNGDRIGWAYDVLNMVIVNHPNSCWGLRPYAIVEF